MTKKYYTEYLTFLSSLGLGRTSRVRQDPLHELRRLEEEVRRQQVCHQVRRQGVQQERRSRRHKRSRQKQGDEERKEMISKYYVFVA